MSTAEEQARHYLLNEHISPLTAIMHEADLKAEMQYYKDIENAFIGGANWREKDLKLTWQDIRWIVQIADLMLNSLDYEQIQKMGEEGYYTEILRRFNEQDLKESTK